MATPSEDYRQEEDIAYELQPTIRILPKIQQKNPKI